MAFEIPPTYSKTYLLESVTEEQFMSLAIDVCHQLDWGIESVARDRLMAHTAPGNWEKGEEIQITIEEGKVSLISKTEGLKIFDFGANKENVHQFTMSVRAMKEQYKENELSPVEESPFFDESETQQEAIVSSGKSENAFLFLLKPSRGYFVTPLLFYVNVAVYLLMVLTGVDPFRPDTLSLVHWGGSWGPYILQGQWWRLLTACFVHMGVQHLLLNMFALLFIGLLLEPFIGRIRFLIAYVLTAIFSSAVGLMWHQTMVGVGASGAIFGIAGVLVALSATTVLGKKERKPILSGMLLFVALGLFSGTAKGVNDAAHIGGLMSGITIGFAFVPGLLKSKNDFLVKGVNGILIIVMLTASFIWCREIKFPMQKYKSLTTELSKSLSKRIMTIDLPADNLDEYQSGIRRFDLFESMALDVFHFEYTSRQKLRSELKNSSEYYWKQNLNLINNLDTLHLSRRLHLQNEQLKLYCKMRISNCRFLCKALQEHTDAYKDSIIYYTHKINDFVDHFNQKEGQDLD